MKLEELNTLIENTIGPIEDEIVLEVAREVIKNRNFDGFTAEEVYVMLAEYERTGKTGPDCGWVYVEIMDDELKRDIRTSGELFSYLSPVQFYLSMYATSPVTQGIQLRLNKYPMRFQSITIKRARDEAILRRIDVEYRIYSILD